MSEEVKKSIRQSEFKDLVFHEVDGVFIFLDPSWKRILLGISGGSDSAAMALTIGKLITDNNYNIEVHFMTMNRFTKSRPWQEDDAKNVVEFFRNLYPTVKTVHHQNFFPEELTVTNTTLIDDAGQEQSLEGMAFKGWSLYLCSKYDIQSRITTTTQNPAELFPEKENDVLSKAVKSRNESFDVSDPSSIYKLIVKYKNVYVCQPLRFTDKTWTMAQYKKLGREDLLKITRSCEGSNSKYPEIYQGLDSSNYKPGMLIPECNICFWCHERHWGMKKIFGKIIK